MRREIEQQVERYMADVEPQILGRIRDIIRRVRPPMWESYMYQRNMAQRVVVGEVGDDVPLGHDVTAIADDAAIGPGAIGPGNPSSAALPSAFQAQETWSANVSLQPFSSHSFAGNFLPEYLPPNVEDWEFLGDPSSEGGPGGYNFDTL